jgi:transcriptional regulator with XRE-family HTH domain
MDRVHPLKAYRVSQQPPLTQRALANLLDVSTAAVSRWEAGYRLPDVERVKLIAEKTGNAPAVLRSDLAELMNGSEPGGSSE